MLATLPTKEVGDAKGLENGFNADCAFLFYLKLVANIVIDVSMHNVINEHVRGGFVIFLMPFLCHGW